MKKIISMAFSLFLILSVSATAFAADAPIESMSGEKTFPSAEVVSTVIPSGACETTEEQMQAMSVTVSEIPVEPSVGERNISARVAALDSSVMSSGAREATEEQMQQAAANEKNLVEETDEGGIMPLATWYSLSMTYYGQETNMSCGPACVRMVLKNLTGTSYSEETIRDNTNYSSTDGTYLSDLVSYLNSEQSKIKYGTHYKKWKSTMKNNLYTSIATNSAPAIVGVRSSASDGFPYSGTGGHFVTVYAITSDKASEMLCDPWAGYVNEDDNRWYEISSDDLYDGYHDINCGYAY